MKRRYTVLKAVKRARKAAWSASTVQVTGKKRHYTWSFILFSSQAYRDTPSTLTYKECRKLVGQMWRRLPADQKDVFINEACERRMLGNHRHCYVNTLLHVRLNLDNQNPDNSINLMIQTKLISRLPDYWNLHLLTQALPVHAQRHNTSKIFCFDFNLHVFIDLRNHEHSAG